MLPIIWLSILGATAVQRRGVRGSDCGTEKLQSRGFQRKLAGFGIAVLGWVGEEFGRIATRGVEVGDGAWIERQQD